MRADLLSILPGYEHVHIDGDRAQWFPPFSIAHTAALIGPGCDMRAVSKALLLAPTRLLAYNPRGDRYHLHPRAPISSLLFFLGWPVHRIHLRPWRDDTVHYANIDRHPGRPTIPDAPNIAILSPYLPWPLSHGAAVRIYNLIRESAPTHNIHLLAFTESQDNPAPGPLLDLCASVTMVRKPDLGRLRWASLKPPEALEYTTPAMQSALDQTSYDLLQTEFTHLASYGGDLLVEHDITMDLAAQEHKRRGTLHSAWNFLRWRNFETAALRNYRAIAVMSDRDLDQIQHPNIHVLPNGVDLARFAPSPEQDGHSLLFIGSFRHFPNALAYRFLAEEFWPLMQGATLNVVAGPNPELYYPFGEIPRPPGIALHSFVSDVRPLYNDSNLVLIPTPVSAGTNIKALEAMSMCRAILSTPSGIHGLGLTYGLDAWVAEGAQAFADSAAMLLKDSPLRLRIATNARAIAERDFDWAPIARKQEALWRSLLK